MSHKIDAKREDIDKENDSNTKNNINNSTRKRSKNDFGNNHPFLVEPFDSDIPSNERMYTYRNLTDEQLLKLEEIIPGIVYREQLRYIEDYMYDGMSEQDLRYVVSNIPCMRMKKYENEVNSSGTVYDTPLEALDMLVEELIEMFRTGVYEDFEENRDIDRKQYFQTLAKNVEKGMDDRVNDLFKIHQSERIQLQRQLEDLNKIHRYEGHKMREAKIRMLQGIREIFVEVASKEFLRKKMAEQAVELEASADKLSDLANGTSYNDTGT